MHKRPDAPFDGPDDQSADENCIPAQILKRHGFGLGIKNKGNVVVRYTYCWVFVTISIFS